MAKKNINQDRDNSINGELLTRLDNADELDRVLALEKPIVDTKGNPAAQSFWSTGRNCPCCKGTLRFKEVNQDTGQTWVFCGKCGKEFSAPDVENTTAIGDQIHRQIPDTLVNSWMAAFAREKGL